MKAEESIDRPRIVATITSHEGLQRVVSAPADFRFAEWLELRADLLGDVDPASIEALRRSHGGKLLYTRRTRAEGGRCSLEVDARRVLLEDAARRFDVVDLELVADCEAGSLPAVPVQQRLVSWHGQFGDAASLARLCKLLERQLRVEAAHYKLVAAAANASEALASLRLLRGSGSRAPSLTSFAMGSEGFYTRVLAPLLGSELTYVGVEAAAAPGQLVTEQLHDYSNVFFPTSSSHPKAAPTRLFGILGAPVSHSLSPRIHNGAYQDLGCDDVFVPFHIEDFEGGLALLGSADFAELGFELGGFAVTTPHKDAAARIGEAVGRSTRIGAANTLLPKRASDGTLGWLADSTDPEGVVGPLQARGVRLSEQRAVVLGAGGAGRAAAAGLREAGAEVTIANRTLERAEQAAEQVGTHAAGLDALDGSRYQVVVNATALGHADTDPLPVPVDELAPDCVVVDMVYRGGERSTELVREASAAGLSVVDGREVLLFQAVEQFELMTGQRFDPVRVGERLGLDLAASLGEDGVARITSSGPQTGSFLMEGLRP